MHYTRSCTRTAQLQRHIETCLNAISVATNLPLNNFKLEYAGDTWDMLQSFNGKTTMGPKIGEVFLLDGGTYKAVRLYVPCLVWAFCVNVCT